MRRNRIAALLRCAGNKRLKTIMISDDVFRSQLQSTIASLRYWVPLIKDAARVEESEADGAWRLTVAPATEGACPIELMLHASQRYDIELAGECYEDRPIERLGLFVPLIEAVTNGRIVRRYWTSPMTGGLRTIETIVTMADGSMWRASRQIEPLASVMADEDLAATNHHYLPYRR